MGFSNIAFFWDTLKVTVYNLDFHTCHKIHNIFFWGILTEIFEELLTNCCIYSYFLAKCLFRQTFHSIWAQIEHSVAQPSKAKPEYSVFGRPIILALNCTTVIKNVSFQHYGWLIVFTIQQNFYYQFFAYSIIKWKRLCKQKKTF